MAPVLFLYASQTGNSRGLAKEFCDRAIERGHEARTLGMEHFKTIDFEAEPNVVVVASCTGNGDCPDNGDRFYRLIRRKTTALDMLANTNFAVCSLGDSNYDAFCAVGKEFDKHFERLGGRRFLKRVDVDEVEGIETFVEPWAEKLWPALAALPGKENKPAKTIPDVSDAATEAVAATPSTETVTAADASKPPAKPVVVEDDDDPLGGSATNPLIAPVVAARWLTSANGPVSSRGSEGERRVLHLEVDVSAGGEIMHFEPGDAVGIPARNEKEDVEELMRLLGVPSEKTKMPKTPGGAMPPAHLAGCATVCAALETRVDIGSVSVWPPLPLLRLLLAASGAGTPVPDTLHARAAAAVAPGSEGRAAHVVLQRERPTLAQLLRALLSRPAIDELMDVLPPLAPRFYSIANSPAADPGKVHLCLSIVHYYTHAPDGTRVSRRGLVSNMLAAICAPLLGGTPAAGAVTLPIFKREPSGFELRLPADPKLPVLMVGPGTGLAPFRGFVQHRRNAFDRRQVGPCHLFFGCRAEKEDFLYSDELTGLHGSGAIKLHTAFSRSCDPAAAGYWRGVRINVPYVQDLVTSQAAEVCEMLFEKGGHFYVCGDGQSMVKDVHDALRAAVMQRLKLGEAEAEAKLSELASERRYCREVWN